jgi:Cupin-like domain
MKQQTISAAPTFGRTALGAFDAAYPDRSTRLNHNLVGHPLLSRDMLGQVAERMPASSVEYNLGNLPLGIRPEDTPSNGLSLAETIATIGDNGSWAVLKNVEQMPEYAELLDISLAQLERFVLPKTGPMLHREAFIFVTSPNSITPFHMDPEHNILLQVEGQKTMVVFPAHDEELVPAEQSESFSGGGHRNLTWDDAFHAKGNPVLLQPGDAILMPVKAPHYVKNGDNISVSISITWRSERSVAEGELHAFNACLRRRKWPMVSVSATPERQFFARLGYRIARKLGL